MSILLNRTTTSAMRRTLIFITATIGNGVQHVCCSKLTKMYMPVLLMSLPKLNFVICRLPITCFAIWAYRSTKFDLF